MSKLDQLIKELCPEGVEYKELGEVSELSAGGDLPSNYKKGQKEPSEDLPYPIYSNGTGENALYGFTDIYRVEEEAVTVSGRGTLGHVGLREGKFTPIVRLITVIPKEEVNIKFMYYVLERENIEGNNKGIPSLTIPHVKGIKIPIPPIEVQEEIVRILDIYQELNQELNQERSMRKYQYEYYTNKLFNDIETVNIKKLKEVVKVNGFKQVSAREIKKMRGSGKKEVKLLPSSKDYNWWASKKVVGELVSKGEVITLGRARYANMKYHKGYFLSSNNNVLTSKDTRELNNRYLYHYIKNNKEDFYVEGGTYPRFNLKIFNDYEIPIPPIEVQEEIVQKLDVLESIANSLEEGLPREIELRNKQYEYYRDKLLDFKEKGV